MYLWEIKHHNRVNVIVCEHNRGHPQGISTPKGCNSDFDCSGPWKFLDVSPTVDYSKTLKTSQINKNENEKYEPTQVRTEDRLCVRQK